MLLDRIYYLCVDIKYYVPVLRVFLCGTMLGARDTKEKDDDINVESFGYFLFKDFWNNTLNINTTKTQSTNYYYMRV